MTLNNFGLLVGVHLVFGKNFKLLWSILYAIGQIFIKWPKIGQTIYPSGHTDLALQERISIFILNRARAHTRETS